MRKVVTLVDIHVHTPVSSAKSGYFLVDIHVHTPVFSVISI